MHERNFINRDIKPENCCIGLGEKSSIVYLIDMGLSQRIFTDGQHLDFKTGKYLIGTTRYASINSHNGL